MDHILTNMQSKITDAGVVQWEVADHLSIFVKAKFLSKQISFKRDMPRFKRFFNESKRELFCDTFAKNFMNSDIKFVFNENNDPNQALEKLTMVIQDSYNEVFPLQKLSKRKIKKMNHVDESSNFRHDKKTSTNCLKST